MKQKSFKIINLKQSKLLNRLLEKCELKDIQVLPEYIRMFSKYLSLEAFYVFYGDSNNYILTPFYKKPIKRQITKDVHFDLISPWYYGGPLCHVEKHDILSKLFKDCQDNFENYCKANNIVSEFQRLNPITENHKLYIGDSGLSFNREIVCINLKKSKKEINQSYEYHVRKNLKTAETAGLKLIHSKTKRNWKEFIKIYLSSMHEKRADTFYYLNEDLFDNIFKYFYKELEIFLVEYRGKIIAGTLVLGKYGNLHDYLRGSLQKYLPLRPNDFMIHNIIDWAKKSEYCYYSLGGGHSTDVNDSLLKFKKSFSSDTKDFYIYKKIHNMKKYIELSLERGKKHNELLYENASFFPEYANQ